MRERPLTQFYDSIIDNQSGSTPNQTVDYETSLSEELLKLNFSDRNEIEEEIHGVRCRAVEETPELVETALKQFDRLLNRQKDPKRPVLRNVASLSKGHPTPSECYLNDPDVRLRFLRCDLFVVEKAVQRFVLFLEVTAELFGDFVAERPVRLSDFTKKEKAELKKSRTQFLPFRDRSGRRIFMALGHGNYMFSNLMKWKALVYFHWAVSKDVETQRRGVVFHFYTFSEGGKFVFTEVDKTYVQKAYSALPVRLVAYHVYVEDTLVRRLQANFTVRLMTPERRQITKFHFGTQTETLYKMASFGVPVDVIPLSSSRSVKFSNHCAWLDVIGQTENSKTLPSTSNDIEIVDCPLLCDVVFRVGTYSNNNPGNVYFRELMQSHGEEHSSADNKKKHEITQIVYDAVVHERNGRFLEWWDKGKTWTVIKDPAVARKKIGKAFKNRKYRKPGIKRGSRDATYDIASEIVGKEGTAGTDPIHALQEYYSKTPHRSKRPKTCELACFSSSGDGGNENSCFGKNFFPVGE